MNRNWPERPDSASKGIGPLLSSPGERYGRFWGVILASNQKESGSSTGVYGKPALAAMSSMPRVRFNLSHTDTIALFAFTLSAEVGVDVERIRALTDMDEIARRFFSKEEVVDLHRLPMHSRERAFFACWTAKEAYIKGIGEGLSMPLDRFAVSLARQRVQFA